MYFIETIYLNNLFIITQDVLIECEQKQVMSHASVQKYLSEVWTGELSDWSSWRMMALFLAMILVPAIWLLLSLPIKHKYNKVITTNTTISKSYFNPHFKCAEREGVFYNIFGSV